MTQKKKRAKKTVVVTKKSQKTASKQKLAPTSSRRQSTKSKGPKRHPLIFGKENYKYMILGIAMIALGMILMLGGSMPSPDVWDESLIYSWRRTVLAPLMIVAGLGVEIVAIFKK